MAIVGETLVADAAGVEQVVRDVRASGRAAIDTEFIWERTYAPRLCLVQVATPGAVYLVDPLEGAPLGPIAELVGDPEVEIAMHAATADLVAFGIHFDVRPTRIVDSQVLGGFVGLTASASLERLIDAVLKVQLHHDQGFSDWSRRPLHPDQLTYAGDDVRHLLPLIDRLRDQIAERGRSDWAEAEIERRFGPDAQILPEPEQAWRRVQRRGRLSARQTTVLRTTAAWREAEARRRDMPSAWLVRDPTLVEIARRAPRTLDELTRIRGMAKGLVQQAGEAIVDAVGRGLELPPERPEPSPPPSVMRRVEAAGGLAGTVLKVRCTDADVAPELVATRTDVERFLRAVVAEDEDWRELQLGQGWRWELAGRELVELVHGRVALAVADAAPFLRIIALDG